MRAPLMLRADAGDQRQEEQHDRCQPGGVGERLQPAVVAQADDHGDEQGHPDRHPDQLGAGEGAGVGVLGLVGQVDAVDHRQAEAVEGGDDGQQDRVGVRREDADHDVAADHERRQPGAVGEQVDREGAVDAEADGGVGADADDEAEEQQHQLGAATSAVDEAPQAVGMSLPESSRRSGLMAPRCTRPGPRTGWRTVTGSGWAWPTWTAVLRRSALRGSGCSCGDAEGLGSVGARGTARAARAG